MLPKSQTLIVHVEPDPSAVFPAYKPALLHAEAKLSPSPHGGAPSLLGPSYTQLFGLLSLAFSSGLRYESWDLAGVSIGHRLSAIPSFMLRQQCLPRVGASYYEIGKPHAVSRLSF